MSAIVMGMRTLLCFLLLIALSPVRAAFGATALGFKGAPLGNATLDSSFDYLHVGGIGPSGNDGVSLDLGEADSGVFFAPYTYDYLSSGFFMRAAAYGNVGGSSNRLVSVLRGEKVGSDSAGPFGVEADFTAIGATNVIFQFFFGDQLIGETNTTGGEAAVVVYAYDIRASPFWRMTQGNIAAAVELNSLAYITFPGQGI